MIVAYMRLSLEDGDVAAGSAEESQSIQSQRAAYGSTAGNIAARILRSPISRKL